ncbi:hypothetical protein HHI36_000561 [Cryptolaemus montrouzieri]|uniref:Uncharacterized protein n=1 Tax=Cryptolaemus montrouzieri TaxID=559131 RepID=A0ABD2P4Y0_9CUCU
MEECLRPGDVLLEREKELRPDINNHVIDACCESSERNQRNLQEELSIVAGATGQTGEQYLQSMGSRNSVENVRVMINRATQVEARKRNTKETQTHTDSQLNPTLNQAGNKGSFKIVVLGDDNAKCINKILSRCFQDTT